MSRRGRLVFVTGPTGAGKTSTAMLWAATRETPTWFYDWDAVRSAIVEADRARGLEPMDVDRQYRLAAEVMAASAKATVDRGIDSVAVGSWAHPSAVAVAVADAYASTWAQMRTLDPLIVVLLPSLEVCVQRHAKDPARGGDITESRRVVEFWHPLFEAWRGDASAVVIDTSELSREAAVAELERLVRS